MQQPPQAIQRPVAGNMPQMPQQYQGQGQGQVGIGGFEQSQMPYMPQSSQGQGYNPAPQGQGQGYNPANLTLDQANQYGFSTGQSKGYGANLLAVQNGQAPSSQMQQYYQKPPQMGQMQQQGSSMVNNMTQQQRNPNYLQGR
jgi:hypothetical protein